MEQLDMPAYMVKLLSAAIVAAALVLPLAKEKAGFLFRKLAAGAEGRS